MHSLRAPIDIAHIGIKCRKAKVKLQPKAPVHSRKFPTGGEMACLMKNPADQINQIHRNHRRPSRLCNDCGDRAQIDRIKELNHGQHRDKRKKKQRQSAF